MTLHAAPLEVRVLERQVPARVQLTAARFTCDDRPLPGTSVQAEASVREVKVGEALCTQVVAFAGADGLTVVTGDTRRVYDGALRVTLEGGRLRLINVVDVEQYLPSVVKAEADGARPAALEAQAIVSRTFALTGRGRHERAGYHLCDLAHCQLYRGRGETSADAEAAVKTTAQQVLLIGGIVLKPAFFHSSCGGHTSRAADVFGEDGAGSAVRDFEKGQAAPRCQTPDLAWDTELEREALARALGVSANAGKALEPLRRDEGGRILELRVFGKRMPAQDFQSKVGRAFGWQTVRSMKFDTTETDTSVRITGRGLGHGVGLCQTGARALAEKGVTAVGILQRYFPESVVKPAP